MKKKKTSLWSRLQLILYLRREKEKLDADPVPPFVPPPTNPPFVDSQWAP